MYLSAVLFTVGAFVRQLLVCGGINQVDGEARFPRELYCLDLGMRRCSTTALSGQQNKQQLNNHTVL